MPRPRCCRRVAGRPGCSIFKPAGIPARELEEIVVTIDEFEAIRLADFEGLYQEQAAERMSVSRQTFGRIIASAHKKIAQVLVGGCSLRIEGGPIIKDVNMREFTCCACRHRWEAPFGTGRPIACPQCKSQEIQRVQRNP